MLLRLLLALAMGFGFAAWMPAGDCGSPAMSLRCECCKDPAASSCCAAQENRAPVRQPAAPASRVSLEGQPAALPLRTALTVLPHVVQVVFPVERIALRAVAAGHSFQSVNCVRMV
jgi:hypothetical protein